jgi:hypothetical protein
MGAGDEAALYVVESADRGRARAEMIEVFDQLITGVMAVQAADRAPAEPGKAGRSGSR